MQPYFFQPLLKSTLWGGQEIIRLKQIKTDAENVGESWELSGVAGAATLVSEGISATRKVYFSRPRFEHSGASQ